MAWVSSRARVSSRSAAARSSSATSRPLPPWSTTSSASRAAPGPDGCPIKSGMSFCDRWISLRPLKLSRARCARPNETVLNPAPSARSRRCRSSWRVAWSRAPRPYVATPAAATKKLVQPARHRELLERSRSLDPRSSPRSRAIPRWRRGRTRNSCETRSPWRGSFHLPQAPIAAWPGRRGHGQRPKHPGPEKVMPDSQLRA